jgi:dolichol kinase
MNGDTFAGGGGAEVAASALARSSHGIVSDLHSLLSELDHAKWRAGVRVVAVARFGALRTRVERLLAHAERGELDSPRARLHGHLEELRTALSAHLPEPQVGVTVDAMADAWRDFRGQMIVQYEHLAQSLQALKVPVPSLRPRNMARKIWHAGCSTLALLLVHHVFPSMEATLATCVFLSGLVWGLEIFRRIHPPFNEGLMAIFGPMAHPHEGWKVNSGTWYLTAMVGVAIWRDPLVATLAVMAVGWGDPAAELVGRAHGRHRFANGRSVEGSLGFVVVSSVACVLAMLIYFPGLSMGTTLVLALGVSTVGAAAELVSKRLDDNLTIPLAATAATLALYPLLGL